MTYEDARNDFENLGTRGINLGLIRIERLLEKMGNPQKQLRFIHIAGTNGKGSTTSMLSNILIHAGYTTGIFISPYILSLRESIQVNSQMISREEFASCAKYVYECAKTSTIDNDPPTQFEILTAIAFAFYHRKKCDYVCLEVGMGGRLDSTNVIDTSILQIITSISLDHIGFLGDTIEKIVQEKAGIIKGTSTVIYPLLQPSVIEQIATKCHETNSSLIQPCLDSLQITDEDITQSSFCYETIAYQKSLWGNFQIYNCITVIAAAKELQHQGLSITQNDISFGIENTFLPARMEVLSKNPLILLDGCHNSEGAQAMENSLKQLSDYSIKIIMGVLSDKNYTDILKSIATHATELFAVTPNNPRALPAKQLAKTAKLYCSKVSYFDNLITATNFAINSLNTTKMDITSCSKQKDVLIICGSLYLAQDIRPILLEKIHSKNFHNEI